MNVLESWRKKFIKSGEKHLRFATGYTERSKRCPHASVRIVELLKRRSCGISIQGRRITQHVHMRSCGWMMWRRIVWRIRADRRSRDQWFAGTRWFQTTGAGAATTCRPYIYRQTCQVFSINLIDTKIPNTSELMQTRTKIIAFIWNS